MNSCFFYEFGLDPHCIFPPLSSFQVWNCFSSLPSTRKSPVFLVRDFYFDCCVLRALLLKQKGESNFVPRSLRILAAFTTGTHKTDAWQLLRSHFAPCDKSEAGPRSRFFKTVPSCEIWKRNGFQNLGAGVREASYRLILIFFGGSIGLEMGCQYAVKCQVIAHVWPLLTCDIRQKAHI